MNINFSITGLNHCYDVKTNFSVDSCNFSLYGSTGAGKSLFLATLNSISTGNWDWLFTPHLIFKRLKIKWGLATLVLDRENETRFRVRGNFWNQYWVHFFKDSVLNKDVGSKIREGFPKITVFSEEKNWNNLWNNLLFARLKHVDSYQSIQNDFQFVLDLASELLHFSFSCEDVEKFNPEKLNLSLGQHRLLSMMLQIKFSDTNLFAVDDIEKHFDVDIQRDIFSLFSAINDSTLFIATTHSPIILNESGENAEITKTQTAREFWYDSLPSDQVEWFEQESVKEEEEWEEIEA